MLVASTSLSRSLELLRNDSWGKDVLQSYQKPILSGTATTNMTKIVVHSMINSPFTPERLRCIAAWDDLFEWQLFGSESDRTERPLSIMIKHFSARLLWCERLSGVKTGGPSRIHPGL
jgi:hypothetical protein